MQPGSEIVIDWFKINKMILNPDKFQAILLHKRKGHHIIHRIAVDNQNLKVVSSVEVPTIQTDDKLNFNLHISNICRSAANRLNALIRLKRFLGCNEKKIILNSYFMANFYYCFLVWMIETLQKRTVRFP